MPAQPGAAVWVVSWSWRYTVAVHSIASLRLPLMGWSVTSDLGHNPQGCADVMGKYWAIIRLGSARFHLPQALAFKERRLRRMRA